MGLLRPLSCGLMLPMRTLHLFRLKLVAEHEAPALTCGGFFYARRACPRSGGHASRTEKGRKAGFAICWQMVQRTP